MTESMESQDTEEPIAPGNGESYLETLGGKSDVTLKASLSPFGNGKPLAATLGMVMFEPTTATEHDKSLAATKGMVMFQPTTATENVVSGGDGGSSSASSSSEASYLQMII